MNSSTDFPGYVKYPELQDPKWLAAQMETMTMTDIARHLGCATSTISSAAQRWGLGFYVNSDEHRGARVSWSGMKARCNNPNRSNYHNYGGRGIRVCDRWDRFENFLADMGDRPEGMSLDRIDVNGDYEPTNCRWATAEEQRANQRDRSSLGLSAEDWAYVIESLMGRGSAYGEGLAAQILERLTAYKLYGDDVSSNLALVC